MKTILKSILVLSMVMALSLANVSCQKDSDKQDGLKKPEQPNTEQPDSSNANNGGNQTGGNTQTPTIQSNFEKKMMEINDKIGDKYMIYINDYYKESDGNLYHLFYNKKNGFFMVKYISTGEYLLNQVKTDENKNKLVLINYDKYINIFGRISKFNINNDNFIKFQKNIIDIDFSKGQKIIE